MREDATHRFAFEYLHECFSASQIASSLGIRAGSLPRESIGLSVKRRLPDFLRQRLSSLDFCRFRVHRPLRRASGPPSPVARTKRIITLQ